MFNVPSQVLAIGLGPGVWSEGKRKEVIPNIAQSVSVFPVNVLWVFDYFEGFSDDVETIFVDVCNDFCCVKLSTMFSLCGMFIYS